MLVSVKWLKDYIDINVPVGELADKMILSGSNIETVHPPRGRSVRKPFSLRTAWG